MKTNFSDTRDIVTYQVAQACYLHEFMDGTDKVGRWMGQKALLGIRPSAAGGKLAVRIIVENPKFYSGITPKVFLTIGDSMLLFPLREVSSYEEDRHSLDFRGGRLLGQANFDIAPGMFLLTLF